MKQFDTQVEETLNSLDGIQRAEANPYLYTRIVQRLKNKRQPSVYGKWMFRLAAVLVLFIAVNIFSYLKIDNSSSVQQNIQSGIENFASEYNLSEEPGI